MPAKLDFKTSMKPLFQPPSGRFVEVDLPELRFLMIDGAGDPNTTAEYARAVQWLYSVSYAFKFAAKTELERDYVVPPLEGLWWADDPMDFVRRNKDRWRWTMMIMIPDFVTGQMVSPAREKAARKLGTPPDSLRVGALREGICLQTLHIGGYDAEGPILRHLHHGLMPEQNLTFNGPHHEIYLSDPRRVDQTRLKTILRQPVKPIAA